jgi:hypothetical protein
MDKLELLKKLHKIDIKICILIDKRRKLRRIIDVMEEEDDRSISTDGCYV